MKELPFQGERLLPLTSNVRILKLWNSTVCSVHSGLPSHYDTVSWGEGKDDGRNSTIFSSIDEIANSSPGRRGDGPRAF